MVAPTKTVPILEKQAHALKRYKTSSRSNLLWKDLILKIIKIKTQIEGIQKKRLINIRIFSRQVNLVNLMIIKKKEFAQS